MSLPTIRQCACTYDTTETMVWGSQHGKRGNYFDGEHCHSSYFNHASIRNVSEENKGRNGKFAR